MLRFEGIDAIKKSKDTLLVRTLLMKIMNNDHRAFHELYDHFSAQLYANIFRMVRNPELASEVLQDVFMKIWEKRENLDPEKSFNAYLHQIARNLVYDHFRKLALDKKLESRFAMADNETYSHIEEQLFYKESNQLFLEAVAKLSPQRKQVFTLCKLEGKSYHEVSKLLQISTSTISDHLLKSNKFIRAQMLIAESVLVILLGFFGL